MRRIWPLVAFFFGASTSPAFAAANLQITEGTGGKFEATAEISAGIHSPKVNLIDASGNACYTTAGSSTTCVLGIQGVAGGTAVPISGSVSITGTPSVTIGANSSVNLNQVAGSAVATAATGIPKVGLTDGTGTAITNTAGALDINIKSGGTVGAGSTTSGTGMSVTGCATTTAAPSNTTAQNNFTSCDTAGNTRVILPDPCSGTKSSAAINVTSATTTALVAVSGSTTVYVCGGVFTIAPSATSADTAQLEYGTGVACAGSPTVLTGTFGNGDLTTAAPPIVVPIGSGATAIKSAASNGICIVTTGTTVNVQGFITYVQI